MVLINLKAQYVDLIVTMLSGVAELCLFGAALAFNRYAECDALKRGKQVSVRRHSARTKFLAVFAMVVFIVLEVILSSFSDPAFSREEQRRPCVAVDRLDVRNGSNYNINTDSILITCARVDGDAIFQRVGNRSLSDTDVVCGDSDVYKSVGEGRVQTPIDANQSQSCSDEGFGCIFSEISGREFRFSELLLEDEIEFLIADRTPITYLVTTLFFDIDKSQEGELGRRVINAFGDGVTDPQELRRRILLGTEDTICPFFLLNDATEVPLGLICVIVATWVLSVIAFVSTLLFRRQIFYDMGDPLHWAQRTFRHVDEPILENPVVTSVYEHGERLMYVSSASSEEYNFLRRVKTSLRDWLKRDRAPVIDRSVEEQSV
ncbi:hypothetical protein FGB62_292g04 [Gracilaria domingensis]|nr:hypothetical protein FGB62_292g04 [Gracilaria domingensis]